MYYIKIDENPNHPNSLTYRKVCLNIIKRLFRSKLIVVLLIILFTLLVYTNVTAILLNQSDLHDPQKFQFEELSNENLVSHFKILIFKKIEIYMI